jgi:hypothetical protein
MADTESTTQQPSVCSVCGATSQSTEGWVFRSTKQGQLALCPSCTLKVQQELQQQSQDINMPGAILGGALAAVIGASVWYALVVLTDYKLGIVAIGVGWLVGKGVVLGSGKKRSGSLQLAGGLLALAALVGGEYLIVNYFARKHIEGFTGWLTLGQFLIIYPRILAQGKWILDVVFYLIAIYEGAIQPRPLKLKP